MSPFALVVATALLVDPSPRVGSASTVTVTTEEGGPRAGVTVTVVERPGRPDADEIAIGISDARGRVQWTPEASGPARLRADDADAYVVVPWPRPPAAPLVLLALLGLAGVGAIAFGRTPAALPRPS